MAQVFVAKSLSGTAFVMSATGQTRALKEGDRVLKGETVVTGAGARVELVADDETPIQLEGEHQLKIDDSLFAASAPTSASAAVAVGGKRSINPALVLFEGCVPCAVHGAPRAMFQGRRAS